MNTRDEPNEIEAARSQGERHDASQNGNVNQPIERPFRDTGALNEIPRVRPDDPPLRRWWSIDEEPRQNSQSTNED
ncbi:MAG: hypothetical protein IPK23_10215 [Rhizobiales bacterium]|nr:hypothetical protein [Hyphomicrobiales bacterium]